MRRAVCITMVVLFLLTVITGFAESHVHPGDPGIHTVFAILFVTSILVHVVINRKAFARHFFSKAPSGKPVPYGGK
jgi:hypothetical protein